MTTTTALVTGANKGIGFAIARQLGSNGHAVWLGCRDLDLGEAAAARLRAEGLDARNLALDVTDDDSVAVAAARLGEQVPALDVLVNNAGVNFRPVGGPSTEPVDDVRATFDVNVLGPMRVTHAFLPLLRRSPTARVVMMSSGLGSIAATLDPTSENWNVDQAGYCASKAALNMVTVKFAKELLSEGIKVNAADPGLTATDLTAQAGDRTPEVAAAVAVDLATLTAFGPTAGFFHAARLDAPTHHRW